MLVATPVDVQHAFASHGVPLVRRAQPPQLCTPRTCIAFEYTGGRLVYLTPRGKADFFIVVAPAGTDVTHVAAIDRKRQGIGARTNGSTLLVYLLSSARVARLRAALAGLP